MVWSYAAVMVCATTAIGSKQNDIQFISMKTEEALAVIDVKLFSFASVCVLFIAVPCLHACKNE